MQSLVTNFVSGSESAMQYLEQLESHRYEGFSLVVYDGTDLAYYCNRSSEGPKRLEKGKWHGLSNSPISDPWPKVQYGLSCIKDIFGRKLQDSELVDALLAFMHEAKPAIVQELPETGYSEEFERNCSSIFVPMFTMDNQEYFGTRSTVVILQRPQRLLIVENAPESDGVWRRRTIG